MSYNIDVHHIVITTFRRRSTLTEEHCDELYRYITGILKKYQCTMYQINGIENHIHILFSLNASVTLADAVKHVKLGSSAWMKSSDKFPGFDFWSTGYYSSTHSMREREVLIRYIQNQKIHHKKEKYLDELKRLLLKGNIKVDERFLL